MLKKQEEEAIAERKRKGILSGREIFAQVCLPSFYLLLRSFCCLFCLCCFPSVTVTLSFGLSEFEVSALALVNLSEWHSRCDTLTFYSLKESEGELRREGGKGV